MEPRRFSLSSIMRSNLSDASPVSIGTDAIASAMMTSIVELNCSQYTFFLVLVRLCQAWLYVCEPATVMLRRSKWPK
jgi:hypothetical protein